MLIDSSSASYAIDTQRQGGILADHGGSVRYWFFLSLSLSLPSTHKLLNYSVVTCRMVASAEEEKEEDVVA